MSNPLKNFLRPLWHRYRHWRYRRPMPSETSKCRARLAPYCIGDGVDLGFGGDPITPEAVRVDMPAQYGAVGQYQAQLRGDAADLKWFRDDSLDFVFSSHLLEDFEDTRSVLREWLRVLKPGGRLIIYCPDEQVYREHCRKTGWHYNIHHKHADFSLKFVQDHLAALGPVRYLVATPAVDVYGWDLVAEKLPPKPGSPA